MTIKTLTVSILLATSLLLLTACNDNAKTETYTSTDTNIIIDGSDENTTTGNGDNDNPENHTEGSGNGDDNTTIPPIAVLTSLNLTIEKTSLNKDENISIKVIATYADGTSKDMTEQVEWVMTPKDAVTVTEKILIAKKDNPSTLKAKLGNTLSNTMNLNITWVVNGHVLPPEPDKIINDSTPLGIDTNNNNVRDDVERAIYQKFPKEIRRQVLMQQARAHQMMLADDDAINNAQKWQKIIANKDIACASYLFDKFDIEFNLEADDYMKNVQYNNKDRLFKYMKYNHALGGGVYYTPESDIVEGACEFNVTKALK